MNAPQVLVERRDAIALVTLNRPDRRNAVTVRLCEEFHAAIKTVSESDARVLVLRGAGDDFCVGADIKAAAEENLPASDQQAISGSIYHASTLLHTMPQVTIAAIDGGCAGAGMGWAMACDLRLASTRARFSTAFLNVGVSGDMGLVWSLVRLAGGAKARELLFFPERFAADEAHALGLINRLHPAETLHEAALAMAQELCARDPLALRLMKANCVSAETLPLAEYIQIETRRHIETTSRPELSRLMTEGYARRKGG